MQADERNLEFPDEAEDDPRTYDLNILAREADTHIQDLNILAREADTHIQDFNVPVPQPATIPGDLNEVVAQLNTIPRDRVNVPGADIRHLDMVFALDCTNSMRLDMLDAIDTICKVVRGILENTEIIARFGLVEYRDHPAQDNGFVIRTHGLTNSVPEIQSWLVQCSPEGGTDGPEAVADGINGALNLLLNSEGVKVCVLICDALPHGVREKGDSYPNGCPCGLKPDRIVDEMQKEHIILYTVGVGHVQTLYRGYYEELAQKADGEYFHLLDAMANLHTTIIRDVFP